MVRKTRIWRKNPYCFTSATKNRSNTSCIIYAFVKLCINELSDRQWLPCSKTCMEPVLHCASVTYDGCRHTLSPQLSAAYLRIMKYWLRDIPILAAAMSYQEIWFMTQLAPKLRSSLKIQKPRHPSMQRLVHHHVAMASQNWDDQFQHQTVCNFLVF